MKQTFIPFALLLALLATEAAAQSAVFAALPPASADQVKVSLNPVPPATVRRYLDRLGPVATLRPFAARNEDLKAAARESGLPLVGKGCAVSLSGAALFKARFQEEGRNVYLAGVRSVDAKGLRIQVYATNLAPSDELWLLSPKASRAFGPYTAPCFRGGAAWLPYTGGDTTVLLLKTRRAGLPDIQVRQLSHFFTAIGKADEPEDCYGPIACENPSALYDLGAAVGLGISTLPGGDTMYWTGTLVNNQNTAAFEPYLITAAHCVRNPSTGVYYNGFQVFWDFRSTQCDVDDSEDVDSLPTSTVKTVLACDSFLDAALLELNNVPIGDWGRIYCGWDAAPVTVGAACAAIHHPYGMDMSVARGTVESLDNQVPELGQGDQIKIDWTQSYLTFGSSGCAVFTSDSTGYYLVGMHSSSPSTQDCDTAQPWGSTASFNEFFPQIEQYLTKGEDTACPARVALKNDPRALDGLRQVRDRALEPYALGRLAVSGYYLAAPYAGDYVSSHPIARQLFRYSVSPIAALGRLLP